MKRHTGMITNRKVGLSSVMEFETDKTLVGSVVMPVVFHLQGSYEVQGMVYTTVFKKFENQQLKKMQLEIDTSMINQPMREFLGVLNKEDMVYDFVGGIDDIMKRQVRTITPGKFYFDMDPVQILRAVGVAAQLKFELESDTSLSLKDLSHDVLTIEREITVNEFHRILAFGYAKDSWMLLWGVGLLEILIPGQGFASQNVEESNMLLKMFSKLDCVVEPDIGLPSPKKLWVCIFYFYLALVRKPRDPRVIAAFTLAICSGYFSEAAKRVIHIPHQSHDTTLCELSTSQGLGEDEIKEQVLDLITSVMDVIFTTRQGVVPFKMMRKIRFLFGGIKWDFEHERERDETRRETRRILMVEGEEIDEGDEVRWSDDEYWDMTYRKEGLRRMLECGESTYVFAMILYSTFFPLYATSTVS